MPLTPTTSLGLVQIYNADIQRTLPLGIVLNVGYNGSHGSNLNVVNAPNHTSSSVTTPDAVAFTYQQSIAESTFNALTVNAQKRLQKGIQLGAKYQYAHSIDDASSFGGAATTSTIQDPDDLNAERSNSSFDVRHSLTGTWLYELPVGPNRTFLNRGGVASKLLDGFSISGNFTITSGMYFTPGYQDTATQVAAGGTYTLRPDPRLRSAHRRHRLAAQLFQPGRLHHPGQRYRLRNCLALLHRRPRPAADLGLALRAPFRSGRPAPLKPAQPPTMSSTPCSTTASTPRWTRPPLARSPVRPPCGRSSSSGGFASSMPTRPTPPRRSFFSTPRAGNPAFALALFCAALFSSAAPAQQPTPPPPIPYKLTVNANIVLTNVVVRDRERPAR